MMRRGSIGSISFTCRTVTPDPGGQIKEGGISSTKSRLNRGLPPRAAIVGATSFFDVSTNAPCITCSLGRGPISATASNCSAESSIVILSPADLPPSTAAPFDNKILGSEEVPGVIDSPASRTEPGSMSFSLNKTSNSPIDVSFTLLKLGDVVSAVILNTTDRVAISLSAKSLKAPAFTSSFACVKFQFVRLAVTLEPKCIRMRSPSPDSIIGTPSLSLISPVSLPSGSENDNRA